MGELGGLGWTFREDKAHISLILTSFIGLVLLDQFDLCLFSFLLKLR